LHGKPACRKVLRSNFDGWGSSALQRSKANGQRGWKRQPFGTRAALGTSPCEAGNSSRPAFPPIWGVALRKATVYGWRGLNVISSALPISINFPRYKTAIPVGDQPQVVGNEEQRHVVFVEQVDED
jgi:hypothetical protein